MKQLSKETVELCIKVLKWRRSEMEGLEDLLQEGVYDTLIKAILELEELHNIIIEEELHL